jgi:UV DNA damage endonuclease
MNNRFGFVSNIVVGEEKLYMRSVKLATIHKLGLEKIIEIYKANLDNTAQIVKYCINNNISFYRMGDLFPFITHPILQSFDHLKYFEEDIYELGQLIKVNDIRISIHSSPYCILNSAKQEIVKKSVHELTKWADFLNLMDLPRNNRIVVHTGSAEGGKEAGKKRFADNFNALPDNIKNRLVLENDDKTYSFKDVEDVHAVTKVPIVIDIFHHRVHNPEKIDEIQALQRALNTWGENELPEIHFSCQDPLKVKGSHSATIDLDMIFAFLESTKKFKFDIMLEVKDTNNSVEQINHEIYTALERT